MNEECRYGELLLRVLDGTDEWFVISEYEEVDTLNQVLELLQGKIDGKKFFAKD